MPKSRFPSTVVTMTGMSNDEVLQDRLLADMVAALPRYGEYQAGVKRDISIFKLEPIGSQDD